VKTIRQYRLETFGEQVIVMPMDAQILTANAVGGISYIWAIVFTEKPEIQRRIAVYESNQQFFGGVYVGTIVQHACNTAAHVFDLGEEGESLEPILSEWDLGPNGQEAYQRFRQEILEKRNKKESEDKEFCAKSQRVDGKFHSWEFDGDDPWIVCCWCGERRRT
jgi:hypothetical protein